VVKAPVPYPARGPFVVSDGTFVYVGGGYDGTNVHNDTFRYDPVADTWTPLAPAPDEHFLSQAVIDNAKIYNIAGFNLFGQSTTTRIYDIATNTWTTGTPIPEPLGLSDHAIGLSNGVIYIAGGFNGSGAINTVRAYDIATDTWSTLASMPTALYLPGFGIINGKLYVASGNSGGGEVPDLQIYDTATNTWSTGAPVPTPVTAPGSAVLDDGTGPKLYLFSGAAPFPNLITTTQIYDPVSNAWTTGPNVNIGRVWFYGGAIDDSSIQASGGDNPTFTPNNANEQLTVTPCVTPTPTPSEIQLRANGQRVGRHRKLVELRWIGANPPRVDIFRNGVRIARVPTNPGTYADVLTAPGQYTYKVCEAGSRNCSNEVTVRGP
jgi:N-acetylneuraminic acid mutarotase